MWNKKTKGTLVVIVVFILSFLGYRRYVYDDFKRAYESGAPTYEQLTILTGYGQIDGQRYAKVVQEAGYEIDEYDLKMSNRITRLTSKHLHMEIVPQQDSISVRYRLNYRNQPLKVFQIIDKDMNLYGEGIYRRLDSSGQEIDEIKLTEFEKKEITDISITEIKIMLEDIYEYMYPDEK